MIPVTPPLVLILGPFDPTGADGLPADAITCARLACHGVSAVIALTVQDTAGIEEIHPVAPNLFDDQARCLLEDMPIQAIKVGGLFSAETASIAAQIAADYSEVPLVLHLEQRSPLPQDATAQDEAESLLATLEFMLPQSNLVVIDHARLAQWDADGDIEIGDTANPMQALLGAGAQWVLTLGYPIRPGHHANLLLGPDGQTYNWPWQTLPEPGSDAGGVASTTIATHLAQDLDMAIAVEQGLVHAEVAIANSFRPGMGRRVPNRGLA